MNIGPTQQSIEANHVYQRDAIARANQSSGSDDDGFLFLGYIDLFILFGALMTVGMPLKEYVNFDIGWQVWAFWTIELITLAVTAHLINVFRFLVVLGIVGTIIYAVFNHYY